MAKLKRVESGEWQRDAQMVDYRAEWLTDVLVERATWSQNATLHHLSAEMNDVVVVEPGYIWARFWFRREGWIVEKYFSPQGGSLGYLAPVCGPIEYHTGRLAADLYGLALWTDITGRVTVLGEDNFDQAAADGRLAPVAQEQAEQRIRELTTLTAQKRFPPAFVRNFGIIME